MNPTIEIVIRVIVMSVVGGLLYGLIKTALEMMFPEFFGLESDWYKDTEDSSTDSDTPPLTGK